MAKRKYLTDLEIDYLLREIRLLILEAIHLNRIILRLPQHDVYRQKFDVWHATVKKISKNGMIRHLKSIPQNSELHKLFNLANFRIMDLCRELSAAVLNDRQLRLVIRKLDRLAQKLADNKLLGMRTILKDSIEDIKGGRS